MSSATRSIFIFRSLPFSSDARTARHALLFANEYNIRFVCWGNKNSDSADSSFPLPRRRGAFVYMSLGYVLFSFFIAAYVLRHARKGDICIFMDLETAFPAIFISKLLGAFAIFDIVDPFFLVKPVRPKVFFCWLEECVANKAHLVLIPDEMRRIPYRSKLQGATVLVVENVPSFTGTDRPSTFDVAVTNGSAVTLGYFGGLEPKHRGLEDILTLVIQNHRFRLSIGGSGELADFIETAASKCERIKYVGQYDYASLPTLVSEVDIIVGLYYKTRELHRYASPNKYYEHMYFGKPLLTSALTPFAEKVKLLQSGWVVEDGYDFLCEWELYLTSDDVSQYTKNAGNAWGEIFSDYYLMKRCEIKTLLDLDNQVRLS